jgi:hypothetical protein
MAQRNFQAWVYKDSSGRSWLRRADAFITSQEVGGGDTTPLVGGRAAVSSDNFPPFPKSWRPRVAMGVHAADGVTRPIVIYDEAAPLWGALGGTINVRDGGGVATAMVIYGHEGEHQRNDKDFT